MLPEDPGCTRSGSVLVDARPSDIESPFHAAYLSSHHGYLVSVPNRRLTEIEFRANFLPFLPPPPAHILEIGCGTGATLQRLAAIGHRELEGWDISAECLAEARASNVAAELRHCDAVAALPREAPDRYDAVIAKDLLEHLPRDAVLPLIRGLHHVLKPGGVFVARLPNMANPFSVFLRYDDFTHRLGFTEDSLRQVFSLGGFERDRVAVMNDVLPGMALLRAGLFRAFVREKLTGPAVRWLFRVALQSQRKGAPGVDTLRAIVAVHK